MKLFLSRCLILTIAVVATVCAAQEVRAGGHFSYNSHRFQQTAFFLPYTPTYYVQPVLPAFVAPAPVALTSVPTADPVAPLAARVTVLEAQPAFAYQAAPAITGGIGFSSAFFPSVGYGASFGYGTGFHGSFFRSGFGRTFGGNQVNVNIGRGPIGGFRHHRLH